MNLLYMILSMSSTGMAVSSLSLANLEPPLVLPAFGGVSRLFLSRSSPKPAKH
jgi:hypothetical protein